MRPLKSGLLSHKENLISLWGWGCIFIRCIQGLLWNAQIAKVGHLMFTKHVDIHQSKVR